MLSLRSRITQSVLNYFMLQEGKEVYVNELARSLALDSGNLTRKLIELEASGILKSRWQGKERFYALNQGFPLLKEYKTIILKTLGLEHQLKEALRNIQGLKQAVIFGSYAADKMGPDSDIDVLAVGRHNTVELQKAIAAVQKTTARDINMVSMTEAEYNSRKIKKDPLIQSIESKATIRIV